MLPEQNVKINVATATGKRSVGRVRRYKNDAARVAAFLARKNLKPATFNLSPEILKRLDEFMAARVDSANPSETKSQVVERALQAFFRKR